MRKIGGAALGSGRTFDGAAQRPLEEGEQQRDSLRGEGFEVGPTFSNFGQWQASWERLDWLDSTRVLAPGGAGQRDCRCRKRRPTLAMRC